MKRYPLEPLITLADPDRSITRQLGLSGSTWQEYRDLGVSARVADRLAARLGYHPASVWPEWLDDAVADVMKECAECGAGFVPAYRNPSQRFCCEACRRRKWARDKYATDESFRERKKRSAAAYYDECGEYVRARMRRQERGAA